GFVLIATVTLTPGSQQVVAYQRPCVPLWCDDRPLLDLILNVVLFAPLAFGLRRAGLRSWRVVVALSAFSMVIELLQIRIIPGRDASVRDWMANTVGGAVGVGLAVTLQSWLRPSVARARQLSLTAAVAWLALTLLGAWGL